MLRPGQYRPESRAALPRLAAKLKPFDIELPSHDLSTPIGQGDRWYLLAELAACAAIGDIKAARELVA